MLSALIVGIAASSALVVGSIIGVFVKPPRRFIAVALGFASGALITALTFELFEEAYGVGGPLMAGAGLLTGAAVFIGADALLDRYGGSSGFSLLAAITLDGVPENLALGVALIGKPPLQIVALVVAIFVSNLPEALGGASGMTSDGHSRAFAIGLWSLTAALLAGAVVLGNALLAGADPDLLAFVRAFAAGAVLASLAATLMPQAYGQGGKVVAFATAAGFLLSYALSQV